MILFHAIYLILLEKYKKKKKFPSSLSSKSLNMVGGKFEVVRDKFKAVGGKFEVVG